MLFAGVSDVLISSSNLCSAVGSLDIHPFPPLTLNTSGLQAEHWAQLKIILEPTTGKNFPMVNGASQLVMDELRKLFHVSIDDDSQRGAFHQAMWGSGDVTTSVLELILSTGLHLDVPNKNNFCVSLICGSFALLKPAAVVLLCRLDMGAKPSSWSTGHS